MITASNTALMTISTFAHLKFRPNLFYRANKRSWFSHIQHVQCGYLGRSGYMNLLESLNMTKNEIHNFSYHYIQKYFKRIVVPYEYIIQSKARIVI